MIVSDYSLAQIQRDLSDAGLYLHTGGFVSHVHSDITLVAEGICQLYTDAPVLDANHFADFHIALKRPANHRRWFKPQVLFSFDGFVPFKPLPLAQAFALLEWGLNWCISTHAQQFLIIHAAAVEKNGFAAILPAPPGSGKSTLTAGLVNRGWRLLSDELTLITRAGLIQPVARPISLKNRSIEVIRDFAPDVFIGRVVADTVKGTVAHMRAPADSVARATQPARPAWVVFPKFLADAPAILEPMERGQAFIELAENAFNYSLQGAEGFLHLGDLIDTTSTHRFSYGNLEEAVTAFDQLAQAKLNASG